MIIFNLKQAAAAVSGKLFNADGRELARTVVIDSRKVAPGSIYVAIKGERFDGHSFIDKSYENGAVAAVSDRELNTDKPYILVKDTLYALRDLAEFYRGFFDIPVVAVTGSVGKTTTKELISGLLSVKFNVHKTEGNFNNQTGVPQTVFGLREEHTAAVIEMGTNHFGEIESLSKIVHPDVCVFTNIGEAHIEYLGSRDGILRAKTEMLKYAAPGAVTVVNGDDDKLKTLKGKVPHTVSYGLGEDNDYRALDITLHGLSGSSFKAVCPRFTLDIYIHVPGKHMIYNALCALAVGDALGMNAFELERGINSYVSASGRMNIYEKNGYTVIADAYNASPTAVKSAIDVLKMAEGRKVAVLGDMGELGENAPLLHEEVGDYAEKQGVDLVIAAGPLSKNTVKNVKNSLYFKNKDELISHLKDFLLPGDTILVKASHSMHFEEVIDAL